jgi:hypothetical protein
MLLHSLKLDIRSRSVPLGSSATDLYESNDLTSRFPAHAGCLRLNIEQAGNPDAIEMAPITEENGTFAEVGLIGGHCWYSDGRFYSKASGEFSSEAEFVPSSGVINVNVGGRHNAIAPDALTALIVKQVVQSFVPPFYSLKFLHGAVVTRGGTTIMLTGRGGAGKTTTALQLLLGGFTLLSDDNPLFTYADSTAWALSSLDFSQATDATLERLPALRDIVTGSRDHRGKYKLLTNRIQPDDEWRQPQKVTHIVQLSRRDCAAPRFVEMHRAEAAADMMGEMMTVFRPAAFAGNELYARHSRFSFDVISSVLHDARILRLEYADRHLESLPSLFDRIPHA